MRQERVTLKGQDILILLKLLAHDSKEFRMIDLAYQLGISQSEVSQGLERLRFAHLVDSEKKKPHRGASYELLVHGLKYFFPVSPGSLVGGFPTAKSASPLSALMVSNDQEQYVWPYGEGTMRGQAVEPLYPSVPHAAQQDKKLHELLAIVDSLRIGRAREAKIAEAELRKRILPGGLSRARSAEMR